MIVIQFSLSACISGQSHYLWRLFCVYMFNIKIHAARIAAAERALFIFIYILFSYFPISRRRRARGNYTEPEPNKPTGLVPFCAMLFVIMEIWHKVRASAKDSLGIILISTHRENAKNCLSMSRHAMSRDSVWGHLLPS